MTCIILLFEWHGPGLKPLGLRWNSPPGACHIFYVASFPTDTPMPQSLQSGTFLFHILVSTHSKLTSLCFSWYNGLNCPLYAKEVSKS